MTADSMGCHMRGGDLWDARLLGCESSDYWSVHDCRCFTVILWNLSAASQTVGSYLGHGHMPLKSCVQNRLYPR